MTGMHGTVVAGALLWRLVVGNMLEGSRGGGSKKDLMLNTINYIVLLRFARFVTRNDKMGWLFVIHNRICRMICHTK